MPRPRVTFSRNGRTSSGPSGPPNDTSSKRVELFRSRRLGSSHGPILAGVRSVLVVRVNTVFTPYRTILSLPGSLAFSTTGWFARLPMSMLGIGLVLLVSEASGSYGLAGSVAAACVIASAVTAPLQARLVDRYGQHAMLPRLRRSQRGRRWVLLIVAVQVRCTDAGTAGTRRDRRRGRTARRLVRPRPMDASPRRSPRAAHRVRSRGPSRRAGLHDRPAARHPARHRGQPDRRALTAVGAVGRRFGAARAPAPDPAAARTADRRSADKPALGWSTLGPVVVACAGLGVLFGAAEVVAVAVASEAGHRELSGLLLASWATGSMLAALIVGALRMRASPLTRLRTCSTVLALTLVPLPFIGHLGVLAVVMFLAGFAISPTLVAMMAVVERVVPASRLTEGMAWTFTGIAAGVAGGAALAGHGHRRGGRTSRVLRHAGGRHRHRGGVARRPCTRRRLHRCGAQRRWPAESAAQ